MSERFQILSLDGGGLKGIFSAAILAHFEEDFGIKVVDHFDLIVGTSTGGIIALGLGAGLKPRDIVQFYVSEGPKIFPKSLLSGITHCFRSKYKSKELRKSLQKYFGKKTLGNSSKRLVIPSYNLGGDNIYLFKTPHHERLRRDYNVPIWKVAMATCAAPTYLTSFQDIGNLRLIDGGVWANNPTMIAIIEAISLLNIKLENIKVLSLGTTDPIIERSKKLDNGGILQWKKDATSIILRGQSLGAYTQALHLIGKENIFRINPIVPDNLFTLDKLSKKELLGKAEYVSREYSPSFKDRFLDHLAEEFVPHQLITREQYDYHTSRFK